MRALPMWFIVLAAVVLVVVLLYLLGVQVDLH